MPKPNTRAQRVSAGGPSAVPRIYDNRSARDLYDPQRSASVYHRTLLRHRREQRQQREAARRAYLDTPSQAS